MRIVLLSMLCALCAGAVAALAGCGDSDQLPSGVAAKVGDVTISDAAVAREARRIAVAGQPTVAERGRALQRLIEADWLKRDAGSAAGSSTAEELKRRSLADVKLTDADVSRYYVSHRADFGPPRHRVAFLLRVRTVAAAERAKQGLETGTSWVDTFATALRNDPTSYGDALPFVEHRFKDKVMGRAMFTGGIDHIVGPLRTRYGVYLMATSSEEPWSKRPPARYRAAIEAKARPWKLDQRLRRRFGAETRCAEEYQRPALPECV